MNNERGRKKTLKAPQKTPVYVRTHTRVHKYAVFSAKIISRFPFSPFPQPAETTPTALRQCFSANSPPKSVYNIQHCSRILHYTRIHAADRTYVCYIFFIIIFHSISPKRFARRVCFFFLDNKFYPRPRPAPFDLSRSAKLLHITRRGKPYFQRARQSS